MFKLNLFASAVLAAIYSSDAVAAQATSGPAAFYVFCARNPGECVNRGAATQAISLSSAKMDELRSVNEAVNRSVREITDAEHFGVPDIWSLPTNGMGDCEDFALLKRQQLISLGWPSSVLLMTVVRNRQSEGHAVLTVVTDRGDLILDNQTSRISTSTESGLRFFSRQSQNNPKNWIVIPRDGAPENSAPAVVSDVGSAPVRAASIEAPAPKPVATASSFFGDPASAASE